jgi:hypothetical protein
MLSKLLTRYAPSNLPWPRSPASENRADQVRRERGEHHQRPAALAIADDEGLVVLARVQLAHLAQERDLGGDHRLDRLPGHWIREEHDEVARVAELERNADLAIHLEAADSRAVPGTRVDHHERAHSRVGGRVTLGRPDAHQRVVRGLLQAAPVDDDLVVEHQHRRAAGSLVFQILVAALAQYVEGQDGALPGVDDVSRRARSFRDHCGSLRESFPATVPQCSEGGLI